MLMYKNRLLALVFLVFLLAGYYFIKSPVLPDTVNKGYKWEAFDPGLVPRLRSIDDVLKFTDSSCAGQPKQSLDYVRFLSRTFSERFYHGYSYYSFQDNWIAYLSGKIIWSHLSAIVLPDDILKHPQAACSQVSIVLAAALKRIGIPYRKVGLKNHFVLEAYINKKWYLFDPNMEPQFPNGRKSLAELKAAHELYEGYKGKLSPIQADYTFSVIKYGKTNEALAPNASIYHKVTAVLSFLIPLLLMIYILLPFIYPSKKFFRYLGKRSISKV
ncbi:MAG TPA: hypothetical protein VJ499_17040 [Flavisolibacter sp.]|nr:hypothetical protein [Flavisolibacter sp.]